MSKRNPAPQWADEPAASAGLFRPKHSNGNYYIMEVRQSAGVWFWAVALHSDARDIISAHSGAAYPDRASAKARAEKAVANHAERGIWLAPVKRVGI